MTDIYTHNHNQERILCWGWLSTGEKQGMLFRWVWRLGMPGTSLWKEYICKKYTLIFTNGLPTFSQRLSGSVVWYNIFLATC
jgi:hypothetical protein